MTSHVIPLSSQQTRTWRQAAAHGGATLACHAVLRVRRREVATLAAALQTIVRRHHVLRTRIIGAGTGPVQTIHRVGLASCETRDVTMRSAAAQRTLIAASVARLRREAADASGPALHVAFWRTAPDTIIVVLAAPALLVDRWSLAVLIGLDGLDRQEEAGGLEYDDVQYADVAIWQRELAGSEHVAGAEIIANAETVANAETGNTQAAARLRLPFESRTVHLDLAASSGKVVPARATFARELPADLVERIDALARTLSCDPRDVCCAAWACVLARLAEQAEVIMGDAVVRRELSDLTRVIGPLTNVVPARIIVDERESFEELVRQVHQWRADARARDEARDTDATRWSSDEAYDAGFEAEIDAPPDDDRDEAATSMAELLEAGSGEPSWLTLSLLRRTRGLRAEIVYDGERYDEAAIARLLAQWKQLATVACARPADPIARLSFRSEDEPACIERWNQTNVDYGESRALHDLVLAQAASTPDAIAVIGERGALTYASLVAHATHLADELQARGVVPETRVGVYLDRDPQLLVALIAILLAGGAYVPLDPSYPPARVHHMLRFSGAPLVVTTSALAVQAGEDALPPTRCLYLDALTAPSAPRPFVAPRTWPAQAAYVIYTSGSTGQPKGVVNTHEGIVNRLRWMQATYALTPDDRVLQKTPISFDVSVWELFWPLITGARLVLARPGGHQDSAYLARLIADEGLTVTHFVPSMLTAWLEEPALATQARTLRHIICSGEALTGAQQARVEARLPHVALSNLYGPTEAAIDVSAWICERGAAPIGGGVPIGRPIANLRWYVREHDAEGQPTPIGLPGELYLGGIGLARGYHGQPGRTAERFVPDPFGPPGARLYRTGDRVRQRADGIVEYLGRLDGQIKLRGQRIELGEIEAALAALPGIREAAVRVHRDQLVAYVAAASATSDPGIASSADNAASANAANAAGASVTGANADGTGIAVERNAAAWHTALAMRLPSYMIPARFVLLSALPRSVNGKLDRRALPDPPDANAAASSPPRTPIERTLATIWQEVLQLTRPVGRDANFFELGGDSIVSLQVVARLRLAGLRITPRQVFEHPTVAALAMVAEPLDGATARPAIEDIGPLAWPPIARWWWEQPGPSPDHFNQAIAVRVAAPWVTAARAGRAIDTLVTRHAALRLRLRVGTDLPDDRTSAVLVSQESARVWTEVDLRAVDGSHQRGLHARITRQLQASLSLSDGPVLRVAWCTRSGDEPARLVWVVHHLAVDGVSWRILLDELETLCRGLADGRTIDAIDLPPQTASLRAWSAALDAYASSRASASAEYWSSQAALATGEMPLEDPHAIDVVGCEQHTRVIIDRAATRQLIERAPQAYGLRVDEMLLAALAETLVEWMDAPAVRIALEGHGREEELVGVDVSRTIGWFTTLYPVVLTPPRPLRPRSTMMAIKEQVRAVPERGLGYGALRYLAGRQDVVPVREPELVFNYLGQFEQTVGAQRPWQWAAEGAGPLSSARAIRRHRLEVSAALGDGQLMITWRFGAGHRHETIVALADAYRARLEALIMHAADPDAGGYTPSDFPLALLTQAELDRWDGAGRPIEDAYPLTRMQEGLLLHTLAAPGLGVYIEQLRCRISGDIDAGRLRDAWNAIAARHEVLRTEFVWEARERPLQRVRRRVDVPFVQEDWRRHDAATQARLMHDWLTADREAGFDIGRAPLMRVALMRIADTAWDFVWTFHHALLDGWSTALVVHDVLAHYDASIAGAAGAMLPRPRPYRDYVAWLETQDQTDAEAWWRRALAGIEAATSVGGDGAVDERVGGGLGDSARDGNRAGDGDDAVAGVGRVAAARAIETLSAEDTRALERCTQEARVTLNTIFQLAWAIVLARHSGTDDVIFGSVATIRPPELPGIEATAGLFVNTVPVRVQIDEAMTWETWLQALHQEQLEALTHSHVPFFQLQQWSDLPRGQPLVESVIVFQNYATPSTPSRANAGATAWHVADLEYYDKTNMPLRLIVLPAERLRLELAYDAARFDPAAMHRLLQHVGIVLRAIAAQPHGTLAGVSFLAADAPADAASGHAFAFTRALDASPA